MTSIIDNALSQCLARHGIADGVVIIGVSAGIDSIVLADALVRSAPSCSLRVVIAHVNHGLRAEHSDADEAFVRAWAQERHCEYICHVVATREHPTVPDIGIEAVARNLRYETFLRLAEEHNAIAVFTAHTRNDNVETFLMQAARGTGYKGLASIPPVRLLGSVCPLLRPLLDCSRNDVQDYAQSKGLTWRDDHTNDSFQFTRNRVRHQVLPVLQNALGASALQGIHTTAQNMTHVRRALDVLLDPFRSMIVTDDSMDTQRFSLDVIKLQTLHIDVCRLLLLDTLHCTADDIERLVALLMAEPGTRATLHHGVSALRERHTIEVGVSLRQEFIACPIEAAGLYEHDDQQLVVEMFDRPREPMFTDDDVMFDADALTFPLTWRTWTDGDRIIPYGMHGSSVLVSDLLTNKKVPHETRRDIRVLTDGSSILWVCGLRRSIHALVTEQTSRVVRCRFARR